MATSMRVALQMAVFVGWNNMDSRTLLESLPEHALTPEDRELLREYQNERDDEREYNDCGYYEPAERSFDD